MMSDRFFFHPTACARKTPVLAHQSAVAEQRSSRPIPHSPSFSKIPQTRVRTSKFAPASQKWGAALDDLNTLQEVIDRGNKEIPEVQLLQQRTWLIHWSLFVFFHHAQGRQALIELFMGEKYINAITTNCPHILRYLTVAAIISKHNRRQTMKELVKVIQSCK